MAQAVDAEQALEAKKRGNAHFKNQNWAEAVNEFTEAIRLDPSQHVFYSNRSACYAGMKEFEKALEDGKKCVEIKPDWAKGYSRKGLAEYSLGRYEDAQVTYEKGLEYDPDNANLKDGVEQVKSALSNAADPMKSMFGPNLWAKLAMNPQTSALLNDQAVVKKIQMLQSNPQQYLQMFLQDPQMQPVFSVAFGIPLNTQPGGPGRETEAMDTEPTGSQQSSKRKPESEPEMEPEPEEPELSEEEDQKKKAEIEKDKGNVAYQTRQFDDAIDHYTKAYEFDPTSPVYLTNRSAVYFMKEDYDHCVEDCKEAIEVGRKHYAPLKYNAKAFARMGDVAVKQKNYDDALDYYNQSLLEENSYKVRKKLEKIKADKAELERQSYLDEEKALEHKAKGNEHFKNSKWIEAISEYSESLRRNPNDHRVYSNRAGGYAKLMSWQDALRDCDKCLELEPTFAKAYLRKGKIQHMTKEYQKALVTYDKGLDLCEDGAAQLQQARAETTLAINRQNMSGEIDPQQRQRAMADPEVRNILQDPTMNKVLQQLQDNPRAFESAMADPEIKRKLETLIAAGIISIRNK